MLPDLDLVFAIADCRACPLGELRAQRALSGMGGCSVPAEVGEGYEIGGLAFLAEAPGAQEDATGRPLVGVSGRLFDQMLADIGVRRSQVLILNKVKCRPPSNNLTRHPEAVKNCAQWLERELATYQPAVVVLMGNTALRDVYGQQAMIGSKRGVPKARGGRVYIPTWHPAFVRRNPNHYRESLADLELAKELWSAAKSASTPPRS